MRQFYYKTLLLLIALLMEFCLANKLLEVNNNINKDNGESNIALINQDNRDELDESIICPEELKKRQQQEELQESSLLGLSQETQKNDNNLLENTQSGNATQEIVLQEDRTENNLADTITVTLENVEKSKFEANNNDDDVDFTTICPLIEEVATQGNINAVDDDYVLEKLPKEQKEHHFKEDLLMSKPTVELSAKTLLEVQKDSALLKLVQISTSHLQESSALRNRRQISQQDYSAFISFTQEPPNNNNNNLQSGLAPSSSSSSSSVQQDSYGNFLHHQQSNNNYQVPQSGGIIPITVTAQRPSNNNNNNNNSKKNLPHHHGQKIHSNNKKNYQHIQRQQQNFYPRNSYQNPSVGNNNNNKPLKSTNNNNIRYFNHQQPNNYFKLKNNGIRRQQYQGIISTTKRPRRTTNKKKFRPSPVFV